MTILTKTLTQFLAVGLFMLATLSPSLSHACIELPCDLEEIAAKISDQPELNEFHQLKSIAVLTQPLKSSGYLLLADNDRLVWQTQTPIKSTTVISPNSFEQYNKHDNPVSTPANSNNKTSLLISSTFLSILSGDFESLNTNFKVDATCNSSGWDLNLSPTNHEIQRVIKHIQIKGNSSIERLVFTEANDDVTRIIFDSIESIDIREQLVQFLVN